jgi:hypothetical protein
MRVFAAMWLSMSLAAVPLLANDAKDAGKEESPTTAVAEKAKEPAKPENAVIESELQDLRSLVQSQMQELESQRAVLKAQQLKMEALEEKLHGTRSEPVNTPVAAPAVFSEPTPALAIGAAPRTLSASTSSMLPQEKAEEVSPLQLRIGSAYIIPVGFMDFTGVFRSHTGGSGIGTNFGSIPIGTSLQPFQDHLSEFRWSMQNSRIGFRVDAMVKGAHVIGYMESDYLGNNPGNVAVSSNSNTLRSRLYWVDVQKDKWEVLGGQTWSLITPGRSGISPLPGNLFFTQNIDVNYQLGLVWGRIPELRFVVRPTNQVAFAVALDSPEQYVGGSAGGGTIILPASLVPFYGAIGATNAQLNSGGTTLNVPNLVPDVIAKLAFDPSSKFHVELGGLERQFKVWNPLTTTTFTKTGGGGFVNLNAQLFPGFRLVTNNFWSDGGGRYIFGQAPDLIIRNDGSISPIKSGSTVSGFEFTHQNSLLYGYYGGLYVQKNATLDVNNTTPIGYGVVTTGSAVSFTNVVGANQNRAIQEITLGFNQTLWRDAKYGALNFMGQYSFLRRNPWVIASSATTPPLSEDREAHLNMVFLNLRYTLPGSAPTLK